MTPSTQTAPMMYPLAVLGLLAAAQTAAGSDSLLLPSSNKQSNILSPGVYTINSPDWPQRYPNNAMVQYKVAGRNSQPISIQCPLFIMQESESCTSDYLQINRERYCGTLAGMGPVTATELVITFKSDDSVRRRGFSCQVTVPFVAVTASSPN